MKIVRNTYPKSSVAHYAEPGDEVHWEIKNAYILIRDRDGKALFSTAPVNRNGLLRSNNKPPVLVGVIAEVKKKGWILEIENANNNNKS